jgi:hypothetical protein
MDEELRAGHGHALVNLLKPGVLEAKRVAPGAREADVRSILETE